MLIAIISASYILVFAMIMGKQKDRTLTVFYHFSRQARAAQSYPKVPQKAIRKAA